MLIKIIKNISIRLLFLFFTFMSAFSHASHLGVNDLDEIVIEIESIANRWYETGIQLGSPVAEMDSIAGTETSDINN